MKKPYIHEDMEQEIIFKKLVNIALGLLCLCVLSMVILTWLYILGVV